MADSIQFVLLVEGWVAISGGVCTTVFLVFLLFYDSFSLKGDRHVAACLAMTAVLRFVIASPKGAAIFFAIPFSGVLPVSWRLAGIQARHVWRAKL
jgi:hypothetical protein